MSSGKYGSSYSAIRKLGNRESEQQKGSDSFDVPEFVEENLDLQQSAEALAEHFSAISREFQPLNVDELSPAIKDELVRGAKEVNIPILEEYQVYEKVIRAKKPHSTAPGDIKRVLVKECSEELISLLMIFGTYQEHPSSVSSMSLL